MTATARPGFRFTEGKLLVFTESETLRIASWPELTAVKARPRSNQWRPFVPLFRLLRPRSQIAGTTPAFGPDNRPLPALDPDLERATAFRGFRFSIPPEMVAAAEVFPSRQWSVLRMCQRSRYARELTVANPALGFCLANLNTFRHTTQEPIELVGLFARLKQRELLARLGFPGTDSCARILAKIRPEAIHTHAALRLREAVKHGEVVPLLAHVAVINAGVLALVSDADLLASVTPALLAEVAQSPEEMEMPQAVHLVREILNLRRELGRADTLPKVRSVEQARRKHQELVTELFRFRQRQEAERTARLLQEEQLSAPPLPGTVDIVPLSRASELREEGATQHHCVGSYAATVRRGECYIYRVLAPERATLSLVRGADGCWQIEQLNLARNRPVALSTRKAVQDWLNQYSLSA